MILLQCEQNTNYIWPQIVISLGIPLLIFGLGRLYDYYKNRKKNKDISLAISNLTKDSVIGLKKQLEEYKYYIDLVKKDDVNNQFFKIVPLNNLERLRNFPFDMMYKNLKFQCLSKKEINAFVNHVDFLYAINNSTHLDNNKSTDTVLELQNKFIESFHLLLNKIVFFTDDSDNDTQELRVIKGRFGDMIAKYYDARKPDVLISLDLDHDKIIQPLLFICMRNHNIHHDLKRFLSEASILANLYATFTEINRNSANQLNSRIEDISKSINNVELISKKMIKDKYD